jgi:hypothetical protein
MPMNDSDVMAEDWPLLVSFFPGNWRELARDTLALKGLRKDKSEENFLHTLLLHLACGYSLRETVVRARAAQLADFSDVALLKRLRKSKEWLYQLCMSLFSERGLQGKDPQAPPLRLIDATLVKEPGQTGSQWRVHYSLQWPSLCCDYFKLTATEGQGTGESLAHFPLQRGEHLLADRGYSNAASIGYASARGARLIVRLNPQSIRLLHPEGGLFDLPKHLKSVRRTAQVACWPALVTGSNGEKPVRGRICVVRKSQAAIAAAQRKLREKASRKQSNLQEETLFYAEYVIVFTTFNAKDFPPERVLECYRLRWQIELVFKRFKQIADLGHLPKYDEESSKAWLYGKLFVALLTEKLIAHAESVSPWGYRFAKIPPEPKPLA